VRRRMEEKNEFFSSRGIGYMIPPLGGSRPPGSPASEVGDLRMVGSDLVVR
jgi:hypothetical protein